MILFLDSENRIKDVESTEDPSLIRVVVDDEENPFIGWAREKICCYKVYVTTVPIYPDPEPEPEPNEGEDPEPTPEPEPIGYKTIITGMTPYVDSRLLDTIGHIGTSIELDEEENNNADFELADLADENNNSIFELAEYIEELEERVAALEGGD